MNLLESVSHDTGDVYLWVLLGLCVVSLIATAVSFWMAYRPVTVKPAPSQARTRARLALCSDSPWNPDGSRRMPTLMGYVDETQLPPVVHIDRAKTEQMFAELDARMAQLDAKRNAEAGRLLRLVSVSRQVH